MEKYHQKIPIEHYIIETLTKPLHCSVTEETPMPLFLDGIEHYIIETQQNHCTVLLSHRRNNYAFIVGYCC